MVPLLGLFIALTALFAALLLLVRRRRIGVRGSWPELRDQLEMLMADDTPVRGLRIQVVATGAVIRVVRRGGGVELELPAAGARQRSREGPFRVLCHEWSATPVARHGRKGRRVVAVALPPSLDVVRSRIERTLGEALSAPEDAEFDIRILY